MYTVLDRFASLSGIYFFPAVHSKYIHNQHKFSFVDVPPLYSVFDHKKKKDKRWNVLLAHIQSNFDAENSKLNFKFWVTDLTK